MKYRAYDIVFEADGEDLDLPTEMVLELEDDSDPEADLADAISDKAGFLVESFQFDPEPEDKPSF